MANVGYRWPFEDLQALDKIQQNSRACISLFSQDVPFLVFLPTKTNKGKDWYLLLVLLFWFQTVPDINWMEFESNLEIGNFAIRGIEVV